MGCVGRARSPCVTAIVVALLLVGVGEGRAHVPLLRGRLIELVERSNAIVIGTAERVEVGPAGSVEMTARVDRVLDGRAEDQRIRVHGPNRFAPGQRYVFFLKRAGAEYESVQPSGVVFLARPQDDAGYAAIVDRITRALREDAAHRPPALRAALIAGLSASAPPLRYHAALELDEMRGHGDGLSEADRLALQRLLADPASDPAIRSVVGNLLQAN